MPRTVALGALAATLVAWNWLRLEQAPSRAQAALVAALALAPALLPRGRARAGAALVAFLVAAGSAFRLAPGLHFPGRLLSRFGGGFVDFYDVGLPFDGGAHAHMHGVILLGVFAFTLLIALAVAARRPGAAALALVVGAGWPATLLSGHDLLRGAFLLAGVLIVIACPRPSPGRGLGAVAATAGLVVLAAVAASSSPALAKRGFLDWQQWDLYTRPAPPVDVQYVWNSSYAGFTFPRRKTTVLRIKAPPTPEYWQTTVLNAILDGRWVEDAAPEEQPDGSVGEPGLVPTRARDRANWIGQEVTVEALRDTRLTAATVPVRFEPGASLGPVSYDPSGIAYLANALQRGESYRVWSYSPTPTPAALAGSKPNYPPLIAGRGKYEGKYLQVGRHAFAPPFGTRDRDAAVARLFSSYSLAPELGPYEKLYEAARGVAGGAKSPYAAAVALERWFRTGGDFVYDQHPPQATGTPELVDFVTRTHRGYCQHFAGAMALMLRYLGIPARVAAGFTSGRYDRGKGEWVVTDRDAHAWVEVWFRGWGWLPFDPTPSRGGLAGAYSASSSHFDVAAALAVLAGKDGISSFDKRRDRLGFAGPVRISPDVQALTLPGGLAAQHHSRAPGLLRLLLLVLAGLTAAIVAAKLAVRRSRYLTRDPRRLATACRKELRDVLLDQQVDVPASVTLQELAELVEEEFGVRAVGFGLHATAARFGPAASSREAAREMRRDLRELRRALRAELTRLERARGLLSLRSLGLSS